MNENVSDADLERFLRRRDRLSREYAALRSEAPTAAMDALVIERARAALAQDAGGSGWRGKRWPRITALAATVVLSFAVIVRVALESNQPSLVPAILPTPEMTAGPEPQTQTHSPAPSIDHQRRQDGAATAPRSEVTKADQPIANLPRAAIEADIRAAAEQAPLASPPFAAAESRPAAPERGEAKQRVLPSSVLKQEAAVTQPSATTSSVRGAAPAEGSEPKTNAGVESERLRAPAADAAGAPERMREPPANGTATRAGMRELPANGTATREGMRELPANGTATREGMRELPANGTATRAGMGEPPTDGTATTEARRDPKSWLEEIERLRAAGRHEEADREMERFRERYPDYRPGDLAHPPSQAPTK